MVLRAAIVAFEAVFLAVIGQRNVAVFAFCDIPAVAADDRLRISPAVQEQNGLIALFETGLEALPQSRRKGRRVAPLDFSSHIDEMHLGHGAAVDALGQGDEFEFPLLGAAVRLDGGRRAAQDQLAPVVSRPEIGDIEGIVARGALGRIAAVVLLVDDDDADMFQRREHRGARPDGDLGFPRTQTLPFVEALPRRKPAVQDGAAHLKAGAQLCEHLRRQRNFGHQKDGALPRLQGMGDEGEINFRLAAPRDAVDERDRLLRPFYRMNGGLLCGREWAEGRRFLQPFVRVAEDAPLFDVQHPPLLEPLDGGAELFAEGGEVRLASGG